ncbi:MAG TPA: hypothetical protein VFZ18_14470, partial [Longimicrobiaceae bacterium]
MIPMQHCPICGTDFPEEMAECPTCGGQDGPVHRCANCGEEYQGSDACPACGSLREPVPCQVHPERRANDRCVACGQALCEECRSSDRRAALCPEHAGLLVIEGWAQVYSATSDF